MLSTTWQEWFGKAFSGPIGSDIIVVIAMIFVVGLATIAVARLIYELVYYIFKPETKQEKIEKQKRAEKLKEIKARG